MEMCKRIGTLLILAGFSSIFASDYLIVQAPIGTVQSDKVVWIKWTGISRGLSYFAPDSGYIYFDRSPGGGKLSNYRYKVTVPIADSCNNNYYPVSANSTIATRGIAFRPVDQVNMRSGVYYCIVGLPTDRDTLVSNEFEIIVETSDPVKLLSPSGSISDLTPTFSWNANAGVPYYHILLSDEAIKVDSTSGTVNIQGLSVVWQAITPNTQIVYGTPDPSHTITADPPPLSPGQHYTWIVLNNYGNNAAFSSSKINLPPGEFTINGTALKKPTCVYPVNVSLNNKDNETIKFKWTNLDSNANTYKVYVYVDQEMYGVKAKMAVYQTEVAASGLSDTLSADINAGSVFTSNTYSWRAIAIDSKGAGTTSDTVSFNYSAPTGTIKIHTRELLKLANVTDTSIVGLVGLNVEVLDGSLEAPLLFYTDNNGELSRSRPTGTYRITAVKTPFESLSKTVTLSEGQTSDITFFMERPEATVFGKVLDESNNGINLVKVKGVSDRGDTVSTLTDASGNFILNCYGADWNISSELTGFKSVLPKKVTVDTGMSYNFGTIQMQRNPFTLSGVVKNTAGQALLGVDVCLYRDGLLIDRVQSTPQDGSFSFSIPTGTYTITAQKSGFASYSGNTDVLSSKSININMSPGAALISGYVYGSVWVGERDVIAPITGANIKFVNESRTDSFTTKTDVTYGDYKLSLPGGVKYLVFSSADGYKIKASPCTLLTIQKSTQILNDTLQALGMVSGNVIMDSTNLPVGNVSINLLNTDKNVIATGKTSADGYFEISRIPDGSYTVNAGKSGLVLDSIDGRNLLTFESGKLNTGALKIFMKTGSKTIKWQLTGIPQLDGTVKLQSPLFKTLSAVDSVNQVGSGVYVVQIDAKSDSVIDMSYHRFNVSDSEIVHIDTVVMNVIHHRNDSLMPVNGNVSILLSSADSLDSAFIYFKDYLSSQYIVSKIKERKNQYAFGFVPPRDGSTMLYYFKAFRKSDVYGYDKEVYNTYIKPDTSRLTKYEIDPGFEDTLLYPSNYDITFTFNSYYSSNFIKDESVNEKSITWSLSNSQGCVLKKAIGLNSIVSTGSLATSSPIIITVTVDTNLTKLAAGVKNSISAKFEVSGYELKKINVKRIDSRNPNPIFTTISDEADFSAEGIDIKGNSLSCSPSWEVYPSSAGTISSNGVFRPSKYFVGFAQVFAKSGNLSGEYVIDGAKNIGLDIQHMITYSDSPDTAINGKGCSLIFPSECIAKGDIGVIELKDVIIRNQIMRGLGEYRTIDSIAYDIKELKDVGFNLNNNESIRLIFDLPSGYQKQAISGAGKIQVACWNEDSLKWDSLTSKISADGKQVSAGLKHFSTYTIISQSVNSQYLEVSPNPFSPYVRPANSVDPKGTCIKFRFDSPTSNLYGVTVRIYNLVGDLVWSLQIQNAKTQMYSVWWDGKTSAKELLWNQQSTDINIKGDLMCRNGRYFVVVSAKDQDNKTRQIMKPVILFK